MPIPILFFRCKYCDRVYKNYTEALDSESLAEPVLNYPMGQRFLQTNCNEVLVITDRITKRIDTRKGKTFRPHHTVRYLLSLEKMGPRSKASRNGLIGTANLKSLVKGGYLTPID